MGLEPPCSLAGLLTWMGTIAMANLIWQHCRQIRMESKLHDTLRWQNNRMKTERILHDTLETWVVMERVPWSNPKGLVGTRCFSNMSCADDGLGSLRPRRWSHILEESDVRWLLVCAVLEWDHRDVEKKHTMLTNGSYLGGIMSDYWD